MRFIENLSYILICIGVIGLPGMIEFGEYTTLIILAAGLALLFFRRSWHVEE